MKVVYHLLLRMVLVFMPKVRKAHGHCLWGFLPTSKRWKKQHIEKLQAMSRETYPLVVPQVLFCEANPNDLQYAGEEEGDLAYYSELMIGKHMVMVHDDSSEMLDNKPGARLSLTSLCVSFDSEEKAKAAY